MARLEAGELSLELHFGQNLKEKDWFGKQDPYCVLTCGSQTLRSSTAVQGGKNPVWNETFRFNVVNEIEIGFVLMDEDTLRRDDVIGQGRISLAKARMEGRDQLQIPVFGKKSGKQHGIIAVSLTFTHRGAGAPSSPTGAPCARIPAAAAAAAAALARPRPYVAPASASTPSPGPYTPTPLPAPTQLPPPGTMLNGGPFSQLHQHLAQPMGPPEHSGAPPQFSRTQRQYSMPSPQPSMHLPQPSMQHCGSVRQNSTPYGEPQAEAAVAVGIPVGLPSPAAAGADVPARGIPAPGRLALGRPAAGYSGCVLAPPQPAQQPAPIALTSHDHQPVFYALHSAVTAAHAGTLAVPQVVGYPSLYSSIAGYSAAAPASPLVRPRAHEAIAAAPHRTLAAAQ